MTTTITKSIGSGGGRDYATLALFEAALPASLVASDEIWIGECYNDSEFSLGGVLTFAGSTTDATRYIKVTAATGQSFADNASKLTNPLTYNASNGVGITAANGYSAPEIVVTDNYVRFSRLQFNSTSGSAAIIGGAGTNNSIDQCILKNAVTTATAVRAAWTCANNSIMTNSLVETAGGYVFNGSGIDGVEFHNVTMVATGGTNTGAFILTYISGALPLVKNCAVFGFTEVVKASVSNRDINASSDYNSTDEASGTAPPNWGSHSQTDKVFSSQFQNVANDFRAKTTSDLAGAGVRDDTYTHDIDIIGQSRSTSTPTIGAWEVVAASNVSGTGASTLGAITAAGTGTLVIDDTGGTPNFTLGAVTVSGSGAVGGDVSGTGAVTLGAITAAGSGNVPVATAWSVRLTVTNTHGSNTKTRTNYITVAP